MLVFDLKMFFRLDQNIFHFEGSNDKFGINFAYHLNISATLY